MSGRLSRQELDSKLNEEITRYGVAESSNNKVITLSHFPNDYVDGTSIAFKNTFANTAAVTINVNGLGPKSIKKSNGADIPSGFFKPGGIYTIRYNSTNGNFILQGEGGEIGTATANDVLAPKTIGVESGLVTGTIPDRSNLQAATQYVAPKSFEPTAYGELTIEPQTGYYKEGKNANGYGPILISDPNFLASNILNNKTIFGLTGNIPNYGRAILGQGYAQADSARGDGGGALVIEPSRGYYEPGRNANGFGSIIASAPDYIPANIRAGKEIFGVPGTLTPASMGGAQRYASGTVTASTTQLPFRLITDWSNTTNAYYVTVSLDFEPDLIEIAWDNTADSGSSVVAHYTNRHARWGRAVYVSNSSYYTTGGVGNSRVFRGDSDNAYVNATGFRIPGGVNGYAMRWVAIKF